MTEIDLADLGEAAAGHLARIMRGRLANVA
jgi:hypothetical protein